MTAAETWRECAEMWREVADAACEAAAACESNTRCVGDVAAPPVVHDRAREALALARASAELARRRP